MVEVKPDLRSKTNCWWGFWRNKSKTIQFLWHFKVLPNQVKHESFVDFVAFLGFGHLENESSTVLVFRIFPSWFDSFLEKLNGVYFSWFVVDSVAKLIKIEYV